ncbi:MAG: hypothetical protein GX025_08805 [Clostridiales bacterium]|nr:hypothetical protein [Clostridiales bacterium]
MDNKKIKDSVEKLKVYIKKLSHRTKITIAIAAGALLLLILILTLVMNISNAKYTVLYSDLGTTEASSIFQALKEMGADVKIDSGGNIRVPAGEYDIWILQLAAKGYPKTALPYDVFSSHSGMTSTESEKAQWLIYQLQDRIQATLSRLEGVENATVTINVPESSDYVWQSANSAEKSSAGVLLSLRSGVSIAPEQVSAIRNLIAASVPKMQPEDVTVVDAATMLDLASVSNSSQEDEEGQRLAFELMVQNQIEANVVRLLTPRYGAGGVVAVAKVTLDYDKMMTERYELQAKNEEGDGFLVHNEGEYSIGDLVPAGDIVGEENNTDIPGYVYNEPDDDGVTHWKYSNDFDYGYIKTQIESGNAILERATVSVMVDEEALTPNRRDELVSLVSGATDIPSELIYVSAYNKTALDGEGEETPSILPDNPFANLPMWVYIAAGVGLLVITVIISVILMMVKKRRLAKQAAMAEAEERMRLDDEERQEKEIADYKRSLEDIAKAGVDPKNEAIVEEVRNFAKSDPQITANLLRTWLKED